MQRIAVAGERIEERLVRTRVTGVHEIGSALGKRMRFRRAFLRPAESAVAAGDGRGCQRTELLAAVLEAERFLYQEDGPLLTLVESAGDPFVGKDLRGNGHRAMHREALFAMQYVQ